MAAPTGPSGPTDPAEGSTGSIASHEKARAIVEAAFERKAEDAVALDVSQQTSFTDAFVIVSGRSERQVRAIADGISRALRARGERPIGIEGLDDGHWVLIDCNDVICHVFDPETRAHYDLERLWGDGTPIDLSGLEAPPDAAAGVVPHLVEVPRG